MKLQVLMKSGNSFEMKCDGYEIRKDRTTQQIDGITLEGGSLPPYINLDQIEAIVKVGG